MTDELVVDTSALISWPIMELNGAIVVQSQIDELRRHSPSRAEMFHAMEVMVSEPKPESVSFATVSAMETGDMGGLSVVDLHLIALAYERKCILVTDDYRMQNLAEKMGVKWKSVNFQGISKYWEWKVKCVGCGREYDSPDKPAERKGMLGECVDCGSNLKLKKG